MLLLFGVCLIVAGCRRSGGEERKPVEALEKDLLKSRNEKEFIHAVKSNDRKLPIWLVPVKQLEKERTTAAKVATAQEELEKAKDGANLTTPLKDKAAMAEAEDEFQLFAEVAYKFLSKSAANPKEFTQENLYKYLRRENFTYKRKLINKFDNDLAEEEVPLTRFLDKGSMAFVPDVDMNPEALPYVIAHRGAGGGGGKDGGAFELVKDSKAKDVAKIAGSVLTQALRDQDLKLLRSHFIAFAGNHYVRAPMDPRDRELLAKVVPSYEHLLKHLPYGPTQALLNSVEQNVPQLLKIPPDARDFERFKKYLKDSAPPGVLTKLGRDYALNVAADLRNPNAILACRVVQDFVTTKKGEKPQPIGHRTVFASGMVGYAPHASVQAMLPVGPPPEKKDGGEGPPPRKR
jgi:hypothetical protein